MKNIFKVICVVLVSSALFGCSANPAKIAKQEQPGEATGKQELTLYTSQPEADANKMLKAFNEQYPDIKVNLFRSGTEEVVSKVQAEKQSGKVLADVLLVSDSFTFQKLADANLLESYKSKESDSIPAEYVDKNNLYTGTKMIVTGIAANKEKVDITNLKKFTDLTKPEFKDAVMIPSPLYSGAASLNLSVHLQQKDLGLSFYQGLKSNGTAVGKGNGTVRDALKNNEKSVGLLVDYMANKLKQDGAPIEFIYPEDGALYVTEPVGLIKGSQNLEASKKFIDFILSEKGQTLASQMGYTPLRKGVKAPTGLKSVDQIKVMPFDATKVNSTRDADKEKFAEIFGR